MAVLVTIEKGFVIPGKCTCCGLASEMDVASGSRCLMVGFTGVYVATCAKCGHWLAVSRCVVRDLTKEEAIDISRHPQFENARRAVDLLLHQKGYWG